MTNYPAIDTQPYYLLSFFQKTRTHMAKEKQNDNFFPFKIPNTIPQWTNSLNQLILFIIIFIEIAFKRAINVDPDLQSQHLSDSFFFIII